MISMFVDVLPRVVLASGVAWAGANYLLIGPKIGERVYFADYEPICRADLTELAKKAGEEKLAAIELPTVDPMKAYAIEQARRIYQSPFMAWAYRASQGTLDMTGLDPRGAVDAVLETHEVNQRAAGRAYRAAQEKVRAWRKSQIAAAGDICACLGDKAIEANRTDWAIYTGTLSAYTPSSVAAFDRQMANVLNSGACSAAAGAS